MYYTYIVSLLLCTNDGFDSYVGGIDFSGKLPDGLIGILVGVRIDVGARSVGLREQRCRHCVTKKY